MYLGQKNPIFKSLKESACFLDNGPKKQRDGQESGLILDNGQPKQEVGQNNALFRDGPGGFDSYWETTLPPILQEKAPGVSHGTKTGWWGTTERTRAPQGSHRVSQ